MISDFNSLPPVMQVSYSTMADAVLLQIELISPSAVGWLAGCYGAGEKVDAFLTVLIPDPCFHFSCWTLWCNKRCPLATDLKMVCVLQTRHCFPQVGVMWLGQCCSDQWPRTSFEWTVTLQSASTLLFLPETDGIVCLLLCFYHFLWSLAFAATIGDFNRNTIILFIPVRHTFNQKRLILSVYSAPSFSRVNILKRSVCVFCPVLLLAAVRWLLDWSQSKETLNQ